MEKAREKGEDPFVFILDGIEDPHNLGAIIRTANLAGAHGVIIPKRRAVGLTPTVARTSAGAVNYTPVAKVTNISNTIKELKNQGMWFVCADMGGTTMYDLNLTGPIGIVIGNEGEGVSELVRKNCDMVASIPMKGDIDSLMHLWQRVSWHMKLFVGVFYRNRRIQKEKFIKMYEEVSDECLIERLREGRDRLWIILWKNINHWSKKTNALFLIEDTDDLIQEGMIGLFKAVRDFRMDKDASFYHFAEICITDSYIQHLKIKSKETHAT